MFAAKIALWLEKSLYETFVLNLTGRALCGL